MGTLDPALDDLTIGHRPAKLLCGRHRFLRSNVGTLLRRFSRIARFRKSAPGSSRRLSSAFVAIWHGWHSTIRIEGGRRSPSTRPTCSFCPLVRTSVVQGQRLYELVDPAGRRLIKNN